MENNSVQLQPKTWIAISKGALQHNVRAIRAVLTSGTALMAVIKSNAYGHGVREVITSVDRMVDWYGVDSLEEAKTARAIGTQRPILILGYTPRENIRELLHCGFSQTVYTSEILRSLALHAKKKTPGRIHVKIETGTSRQGVSLDDLPHFVRLAHEKNLIIEGMSTHYSSSEEEGIATTTTQFDTFRKAQKILATLHATPPYVHSACSAALFRYPQTHGTLVRAGISMYGLWPSSATKTHTASVNLRPAMTWSTRIAQIKSLSKNTAIGYGGTEKLTRHSRIAVLPIGYWDGLSRSLSSLAHVLVHGRRARVIGRICMNMCMIDVTEIPRAQFEDTVVILGRQHNGIITPEEIANEAGIIHYEIITRINPLIPRVLAS